MSKAVVALVVCMLAKERACSVPWARLVLYRHRGRETFWWTGSFGRNEITRPPHLMLLFEPSRSSSLIVHVSTLALAHGIG